MNLKINLDRGIKWPGRANLVVSLVALHKGEWRGKRVLDGKAVPVISAYFEADEDQGVPVDMPENKNLMFQGVDFLGDGFLLTPISAEEMLGSDSKLEAVILPTINGQELNSHPLQTSDRWIINFFDWPLAKAERFPVALDRVEKLVKPERERQNDVGARTKWWQFLRPRMEMYSRILGLERCFVSAVTTKHLNLVCVPPTRVFLKTLKVLTTDRWDIYVVVQSTLHEVWARMYSSTLKQDLRYSTRDCFENFPFPEGLWQTPNPALAEQGERYHEHRRTLMLSLWLGLTDLYNLFHTRDLTPVQVAKVSKKSIEEAEAGYQGILELRRLHRQLDLAIRDAYGWADLDLGHDFHEVETLPENDRVRYTISPAARREVLKRLLAENHHRAAAQALVTPERPKTKRGRRPIADDSHGDLFA